MSVLSGGIASYTYGSASHKHAVTALSSGESYTYDANGNMTQRVEGGLTYTQTFDAENRLVSVAVSGQTTQFIYDGEGNLAKKIKPDGSWTIFVGKVYEVDKTSGGVVTRTLSYYGVAGAMRISGTLYFVLTDQLGSASVVTDNSGAVVGDQRYYPYGETRVPSGNMQTDRLFTGQRQMASLGNIYNYGARFYSPLLGRFLSADTIVPGYANPQNLNHYTYVLNNPLLYIDPNGKIACVGSNWDDGPQCFSSKYAWTYGITFSRGTTEADIRRTLLSASRAGEKLATIIPGNLNPQIAFRKSTIPVQLDIIGDPIPTEGNCSTTGGNISCHQAPNTANFLHEVGHVVDNLSGGYAHDLDIYPDREGNWIDTGPNNTWRRGSQGFLCVDSSSCMEHPPRMGYADPLCNVGDPQASGCAKQEQWADLFMNWVLDGLGDPNHGFASNPAGDARRRFMIQQFNWLQDNGYWP